MILELLVNYDIKVWIFFEFSIISGFSTTTKSSKYMEKAVRMWLVEEFI